jgi:hypothetical protein
MRCHTSEYYREAITATGDRLVHTHFGGRFQRQADGTVTRLTDPVSPYLADERTFLKAAREIVGYGGHVGYELCSPVLVGHRHAGLHYALLQAELACEFMQEIIRDIGAS